MEQGGQSKRPQHWGKEKGEAGMVRPCLQHVMLSLALEQRLLTWWSYNTLRSGQVVNLVNNDESKTTTLLNVLHTAHTYLVG